MFFILGYRFIWFHFIGYFMLGFCKSNKYRFYKKSEIVCTICIELYKVLFFTYLALEHVATYCYSYISNGLSPQSRLALVL